MGVVTTLLPGRAFTRADLDAMPDDGRRYKLIDGALIMTPAHRSDTRWSLVGSIACSQRPVQPVSSRCMRPSM